MSEVNTETDKVKLTAVGDIMAGIGYFHSIIDDDNIPAKVRRSPADVVNGDVVQLLRSADLLFGNLECVISETVDLNAGDNPKRYVAPPETINFLKYCGFDVLNVGNNHTLDHGTTYLKETLTRLEQNDIRSVGNLLASESPTTITRGGIELHFVGYHLFAGDDVNIEAILQTVKKLRNRSGVVVVSLHWGQRCEHMLRPSPEQIELGRKLIDTGADIILGHHSHTFQPVERYNGGIIAYSLGNFLFDMWRKRNRETGILEITIQNDKSMDVKVIPIKQTRNQITFTNNDRISDAITENVSNQVSMEQYMRTVKAVKRRHILDVILLYLRNAHRFSTEFHKAVLRRWALKAFAELRRRI